jgi:hypothetical protein
MANLRSLAVTLGLAMALHSGVARADKTTTYDGKNCKATNAVSAGFVSYADNDIKNTSTNQSIMVACPVVKYTSGPGIWNDRISGLTVTQNSPISGDVECNFIIYDASYEPGESLNVWANNSGASTTSGTSTFNIGGASWTGWWSTSTWFYANVICRLQPGAKIEQYTVTELGAQQANHRIFSPASCGPTAGSNYLYGEGTLPNVSFGGYWQSASSGTYRLDCPIPSDAARGVQMSGSPSVNVDSRFECSHNASSWALVPPNSPVTAVWTKLLPFAFPSGNRTLSCQRVGTAQTGDPRFFSYRTFPLTAISRAGWFASASQSGGADLPQNAVSGGTTDRWSTGQPQTTTSNAWFQVDMGSSKQFVQIQMSSNGPANNDYPRGYSVYASTNGSTWGSAIATGTGSSNTITVQVPPTTARYIRVYETGTSSQWFSFDNFNVYQALP